MTRVMIEIIENGLLVEYYSPATMGIKHFENIDQAVNFANKFLSEWGPSFRGKRGVAR